MIFEGAGKHATPGKTHINRWASDDNSETSDKPNDPAGRRTCATLDKPVAVRLRPSAGDRPPLASSWDPLSRAPGRSRRDMAGRFEAQRIQYYCGPDSSSEGLLADGGLRRTQAESYPWLGSRKGSCRREYQTQPYTSGEDTRVQMCIFQVSTTQTSPSPRKYGRGQTPRVCGSMNSGGILPTLYAVSIWNGRCHTGEERGSQSGSGWLGREDDETGKIRGRRGRGWTFRFSFILPIRPRFKFDVMKMTWRYPRR